MRDNSLSTQTPRVREANPQPDLAAQLTQQILVTQKAGLAQVQSLDDGPRVIIPPNVTDE